MTVLQPDETVPMNRADLLTARDSAMLTHAAEGLPAEVRAGDLVPALRAASDWANRAGQWLVVVAPWGIHRLGDVETGVLEQALRRFADSLRDPS
jgi:hypothetical protein